MNTYDEHNPIKPINQKELPTPQVTIDESWYEELKNAYNKMKKLKHIIEYCEQTDNTYLLNKLKNL